MKVADKHGSWFTNFSQFRMHDPMSDTYFESGEPTKATPTAWLDTNKEVVKPTNDEGLPDDGSPSLEEAAEAEAAAAPRAKGKK